MNIEKRSNGKYRVTEMKNGKRYRITFDYKPSKREAEDAIDSLIAEKKEKPNGELTFQDAAKKYVEMKYHVLSPNTVREYSRTCNRLSEWFIRMKIDDIDQVAINKQINELAARLSPKTVSNYHGFISTILGTFRPNMNIYTTLPQKRKYEPYIPSDDDVKRIMEALKGTEYFVGIFLACMGMRRGEILALTPEDIDENKVLINKAMAIDPDRKKVIKRTKTVDSEREIIIPAQIADMIRDQGYVYRRKPGGMNEKLTEVQKKLGIEHFTLHTLRHYFASKIIKETDMKTVMALCGWKSDYAPRKIYVHSLKEEQDKAKKLAAEKIQSSLCSG